MKLIICGAGQVGWQIAKHLSSENNDITVIDKDPELVRRLTNSLDVAGVTGLASHPHILERAGAKDADMIIAVTNAIINGPVDCKPLIIPMSVSDAYPHFAESEISITGFDFELV